MSVLKMFCFGPGQILLSPDTEIKIRSRKEFALLVYLAVENDRTHSREVLLGLLWPELSQDQARNNLRVALTRLRTAIKPAESTLIQATRLTLGFDGTQLHSGGNAWLDVVEFDHLLVRAESHNHADPTQCKACMADMVKASQLYQGEFLHGFNLNECEAFEHWLLVQRERYHMQIMSMLPRLEAAYIANQEWKAAEKIIRHRLALDPLDEDAHRSLMQVLALSGLRNAALSHYDILMHLLEEELGVQPDDETVAIVEQIQSEDFPPQASRSTTQTLVNSSTTAAPAKIENLDPYAILSRLDPLPEQTLFGVDQALQTLSRTIKAEQSTSLLSIEGIGGLGKTTLAHALVKDLLSQPTPEHHSPEHHSPDHHFRNIGWVSAKQEEYLPDRGTQATGKAALDAESLMDQLLAQLSVGPYPTGNTQGKRLALTQLLKETAHLIVIDNLETAVDYQALLPLLRHLANPTKFLITSRVTLSSQGDVFCYSLAELTEADALAFLRHEATTRGMTSLIAATDEQLRDIYETVGGNPLALKLVLSQIQFLPLDQLLESLRQADSARSTQLYTYIYWQSWQMLDATSRHLLLCLPIVPNATFAQLQTISGLETDLLQTGLMNLRNFSLVEVSSDLSAPRYRLHRLTESFLMHEVIKWQNAEQSTTSAESKYFVQRVLYMVQQWNEADAVHEVDVTILDHEYESVVKAISLGLEIDDGSPLDGSPLDGWLSIKPLIIAFTPYMERRGHWKRWHSILARAIDAANRAEDVDGEITLTSLLARLCQQENRQKDVVYHYRRVIRMARRNNNRFEEARSCSNLGYLFVEAGQWWRSEILSCHAMAIFEELESEHGLAHTSNHLGVLYTRQERWEQAEKYLLDACKIWEKNQDSHSLTRGYVNLGLMYIEMGNSEPALKHLSNAYHTTQITGDVLSAARIWNNMAAAHRLNSDWQNANKLAKQAEDLFREHVDFTGLANVWHNLGLIAYDEKKYEISRNYLEESLGAYQSLDNAYRASNVSLDLKRVTALLVTL